ncbi:class I adenylate-forming enzyme family protein [Mesorhizobium sp. ANAO-SY3R2]|uniref:class I adenylate-forming enzyme family protein n=1 Tax=Mesorhizobium sp. ANAO-SY3R2 TaxID=3166644 RepID=UPI00366AAAF2
MISEQADRFGDHLAIISQGRQVSYSKLHQRAQLLAAALAGKGIVRGDRIGVLIPNRIEWIELCLAASGAGATLVPFTTWSTRPELEFLLADSDIKMLFAAARFAERDFAADLAALLPQYSPDDPQSRFPTLREVVLIDAAEGHGFTDFADFARTELACVEPLPPRTAASAADDGLILYTSGSSATPKAVRLKQYGIVENGFNIGERQGLLPGDRVLVAPPLFWSYGSANALPATLSHGATLVLQEKFEPGEAMDLIETHRCTALYTLPGMTQAMLRHPDFNRSRLSSLRTGLTIGSESEVVAAAEGLGIAEICNIYGATETYGNCCVTWHHWPLAKRTACQGPPLPGNELRFVDLETGLPVAAGENGLVEVRGYVTVGYSGASAALTGAAITPDGYYRTGDVGRLDADGNFVFVGRNTEMIKRAGINISPAEVEEILLKHPAVTEAAVVGVADAARGECVVAFVVQSKPGAVTAADLRGYCRDVASKYKIPDHIEVCEALPTTATGKLQRRILKEIAAEVIAAPGLLP